MNIRNANIKDMKDIYKIHKESFFEICKSHYTLEQLKGTFNDNPNRYKDAISRGEIVVACEDEKIFGFGKMVVNKIIFLFIDPKRIGTGIGRLILEHMVTKAKNDRHAKVIVESTLNAESFYEKLGFKKVKGSQYSRNNGLDVSFPVVQMELSL